jgi:acetyl esterase/lipase
LPRALFTVGTADPLIDDSLFLCARWIAAGLATYAGAPHAFNSIPTPLGPAANERVEAFLRDAIADDR